MKLAVSVVVFQEEINRNQIDLKGLIEFCQNQGIGGIEFRKNLFGISKKKVDEVLELFDRKGISPLYATESILFNRDKDNTGKIIDDIDFGGGEIDFPGVLNELQQINYEGFLCLEFDGKGHGMEVVCKSIKYLKKICGKELKI